MTKHVSWLWICGASLCSFALACSSDDASGRDPGGSAVNGSGPTSDTTTSSGVGGASSGTDTTGGTTVSASVTSDGSSTTTTTSATTSSTDGGTTSSGGASSTTTTTTTADASTTTSAGGATGAGGTSTVDGGGGTSMMGDCSSLPICEDFEGGTPGSDATIGAFTTRTEGSGSIVFDSDAHGGSVSVLAQGQMAYLVNSDVAAAAPGVLYVRAYMKLGEAVSMNHVGYITISGVAGMENDEMRFGGQNGQLHFNESAGDGLAPDPFEYPECTTCITMTPNEWTCVEVMFDYQNEVATAWVGDGSFTADEAADFHSGSMTWPASAAEVKIGFRAWGGENTVWYDDVAVAYERIGCQ